MEYSFARFDGVLIPICDCQGCRYGDECTAVDLIKLLLGDDNA